MQCNESGKMQELKDIRAVLKKSKKSQNKMQPNWVHKAPKKFKNLFLKKGKEKLWPFFIPLHSISSFSLSEAFW